MDFNSALVLPSSLPHVDDTAGREALDQFTHGRLLPGLRLEAMEQRSRRLLNRLRCAGLQGSQLRGSSCAYYTELVTHELAHAILLGLPLNTTKMTDVIARRTNRLQSSIANTQEMQACAITMLVLEYLGLPYDIFRVILSTSQNLRGQYITAVNLYPYIVAERDQPAAQRTARQIACRLLKMKYAETQAS